MEKRRREEETKQSKQRVGLLKARLPTTQRANRQRSNQLEAIESKMKEKEKEVKKYMKNPMLFGKGKANLKMKEK